MAVDDLPRSANPTVDLGGIPASQDTFRSTCQFSVVDKIERQERHISMALNLGIDHVVPWIRERGLHFLHCRRPHLHHVQPIDASFRKRIEIRHLWGLDVEVALRVQLNPAVKRRTLQGDELFEQAIHRTSSVLSGHRNESTRQKRRPSDGSTSHEEGGSAKATDRSQLQSLLKYCRTRKGKFHFVVIYNL